MKILHVGEYVSGGVATYISDIVAYQSDESSIQDIMLMISNQNTLSNKTKSKVLLKEYKYKRKLYYIIKSIFVINRIIKEFNPDIIHVHSTYAGLFVRLPFLFGLKRKIPKIIYCAHGWSFLMEVSDLKRVIFLYVEKLLLRKTDIVINISEFEDSEYNRLGLIKSKSKLINNGVSNKKIEDNSVGIKSLILVADKIKILFVGRFDKQKGLDILLDFLNQNLFEQVSFIIVGYSVLDKKSNTPVPKNTIIVGKVKNEDINYYYSICDAVIIPSRWEGFGLVGIEAMRNKKPIIVSNRGALPSLVSSKNGFVFDLDRLDSLKYILDNLELEELKYMGENGYKLYKEKYTSDIMNKKLVELYKELN